ncbi:MAG: hypothetical protein P8R54_05155 [Myxococcota bacterium]|nr:hypothetical protein [Myxococcota bacterium]
MSARYFFLVVVLPLVVGGLIYILLRADTLLMFQWAENLSLTALITHGRAAAAPLLPWVPGFVLFSIPDGIWVFSATAFFARLWHDGPLWARALWIGAAPIMAIGGELGQIVGLVPGTFDVLDLLAYAAATLGALAIARWSAVGSATGPVAAAPL